MCDNFACLVRFSKVLPYLVKTNIKLTCTCYNFIREIETTCTYKPIRDELYMHVVCTGHINIISCFIPPSTINNDFTIGFKNLKLKYTYSLVNLRVNWNIQANRYTSISFIRFFSQKATIFINSCLFLWSKMPLKRSWHL